jgi:F-type H+-transporting ATPase subunit delta
MPAATAHSAVASTYARALLELAQERQQAEAVGHELAALGRLVEAVPMLDPFLADPSIKPHERSAVLERAVRGKVSDLLWNFLGVLNRKDRSGWLTRIAAAYRDMLDEAMGRIEVAVHVAQELDPATLEEVRARISAALRKDARVKQTVEPALIGGIVVQIEDQLIDGSVRAQLDAVKRQLAGAATAATAP